jgi:hypothetical protein
MVPSVCVSSDRAKSGQVGKSSAKGFVSFGRVIVSSRLRPPAVDRNRQLVDYWRVNPPGKPARDLGAWRDNGSVYSCDRVLSE